MNSFRIKLTVCLSILVLSACSSMGNQAPVSSNGILVGDNGMSLYVLDRDVADSGKSVCVDECAKLWPPYLASSSATASGNYSLITRADGSKQWAYKGRPLYFWSKDMNKGDMTGDNVNKVWHVIKM